MTDFKLSGLLELNSSDFVDSANNAEDASDNLSNSAEDTSDSLLELEPAGAAAGGALVAVGTAAQDAFDSTRDIRTQLDQAAISAGVSSEEMTQLAKDVSDAGTPMQETAGTLSVLADRGVESEEKMASLSEEFTQLAQATGTKTPEATQTAIQTMRAFGGEIEDIEERADTMTAVTRSTSLDFREFGEVVGDVQPVIDDLGLTFDDVAAFMMALEDQGVNSQRAQELFAQAAEDAEGDMSKLNEELGISQSELAAQKEELSAAEGVTDEYSEAAEGNISAMDRLKQRYSEVQLAAANVLQPVSAVAPAMQAAGGAAITLSTINVSAVVPSLQAVNAALLGPVGILIGLAAAVGALAIAWDRNIFGIRDKTEAAVEGTVGALTAIPEALAELSGKALSLGEDAMQALADGITNMATAPVDAAADVAGDVAGAVADRLPGSDAETGPLSNFMHQAESLGATPVEELESHVPQARQASTDLARATQPAPESTTTPSNGAVERLARVVEGMQGNSGPAPPEPTQPSAGATLDGQDVSEGLAEHDIRQLQARQRNGP